ncbi:hypothetical protein N7457_002130 [Penicillium paradoxum]|uniref:uncharacterized protein n=1 Tax=Penicillium paradoxum TaxID=176176 RepID=UPI002547CB93|nr:uncharacterized protein N7457_002130 [Penicillium paradoxum]KAJ5787140.1 hypothetical protein N7457_002130 [Penicillium paradoxum]
MSLRLVAHYFFPDFTWKNSIRLTSNERMPPTPRLAHPYLRRFWGIVHDYLQQIAQLLFGLILKWSDGTRLEEVLAMEVAREAGLPVPRVICYGEHPDTPHAPVSILITRIPGEELGQVDETLSEDKFSVLQELNDYLEIMRGWQNPWDGNRICSLVGTAIRSAQVPSHFAGPFESEEEFNEYLIRPSWSGSFLSETTHKETMDLFVDIVTPNGHSYKQPTGLFINNEVVSATGGQTITSLDPATDKPIATVQAASTDDVDRAVKAARAALIHPSWKKLPATERGQLMARLADLMEENRALFASIEAWDNGMF